jgi:hypothetical protein
MQLDEMNQVTGKQPGDLNVDIKLRGGGAVVLGVWFRRR